MLLSVVIERAAQINPRGGGTAFAGRHHDWSPFLDRVRRIASGLRAHGLVPGERVAVIALNGDRFCELFFAIGWAGGVQPVNMRLAPPEMASQIEDAGARMIVTEKAGALALGVERAALAHVETWFDIGETGSGGVAVTEERVTRSSLGPTMIKMLIDHPRFADFDLSSLCRLHHGSAPIAEALLEETIRKLPGVGLIQGYGQTEASGAFSMLAQRYHVVEGPDAGKLRSAGQAVPGVDVRIAASDGSLAEPDPGEICVRGDPVMLGYWQRPDETAAALQDGWLHTGDIGYLDDDGFLFVADWLKDMIVTGGENVFSAEVESALLRHPDVAECAVIGVPSEVWGEQVHAIVRRMPGSVIEDKALMT